MKKALVHYQVAACDAEESTDMLTRFRPDALVLDLFLPGTDGLTLMENCRRVPSEMWTM